MLGTFEKDAIKPPDPPIVADPHVLLLTEGQAPGEAEAEDFDDAILEQSLMLAVQSSEFPSIEDLIVRHWHNLGRSEPGYPGFLLAREMRGLPFQSVSGALACVERRLEDLRSTIRDADTSIAYFSACLCFAQFLRGSGNSQEVATAICRASIATAAQIIAPQLQKPFMRSLGSGLGTPAFAGEVGQFSRVIARFTTPSQKFLCGCIVDELDCLLANAAITQASANTLTLVLAANTAASHFTTACRIALPRFRQVLLCLLAHDEILQNPRAVLELAPLVPPTFAYFLFCSLRPDVHLPEALDYRMIERFASEMDVNLQRNLSVDIVFRAEVPEIPPECSDFAFHD
jgi:hypothetical protein